MVLERNKVASTMGSFPPGKTVCAELHVVRNASQLDFDEHLDKDEFLELVNRLAADKQLHVKEESQIARVRKLGQGHLQVETKAGKPFPARQVLVAIGRQGQLRLVLRGEPITRQDSACVGCAESVVRCPMEVLHLGDVPSEKRMAYSLLIIDTPIHPARREVA